MTDSAFISNVTELTFEQEVIARSMTKPVLVDFWADWCNPCKILMPILSKLAEEYNGEFYLAKVNSDQEKNLSDKYGIRSLPSVKIFKQGNIVDEFNGAIPESKIRDFIDRHLFKKNDFAISEAKEAFSSGNIETAKNLINNVLAEDKSNKKAIILSARILVIENLPDQAEALLKHLPLANNDDEDIHHLRSLISLSKDVVNAPDIETLKKTVIESNDENNIEAKFQLACRYALNDQFEEALKLFIEIVEKDKTFKEGAARKHIIAIFDVLGGSGPLVNIYRIKLSRLLH